MEEPKHAEHKAISKSQAPKSVKKKLKELESAFEKKHQQ